MGPPVIPTASFSIIPLNVGVYQSVFEECQKWKKVHGAMLGGKAYCELSLLVQNRHFLDKLKGNLPMLLLRGYI